jgi:hypothetical protein
MAVVKLDGGYNALPISYKRGNPIPLDTTMVWYNFDELKAYAESGATAYPGQVLTLVDTTTVKNEKNEDVVVGLNATVYVIKDSTGTLIELGDAGDVSALKERVDAFLGTDPDILKKTLDSLKEIQDFISSEDGHDSFLTLAEQVNQIYSEHYELYPNGKVKLYSESDELVVVNDAGVMVLANEYGEPLLDENGEMTERLGEAKEPEKNGLLVKLTKEVKLIHDPDAAEEDIEEPTSVAPGTGALPTALNKLFVPLTFNGENETVDTAKGYVVDYIANELPIANTEKAGRVLSTSFGLPDALSVNMINVHADTGAMEVIALSTDKLVQGENTLVLDCGNSTEPLN